MDGMKDNNAINPEIENKKSNTFNLIIGVATLLIALLGATFAYFTATARSAEGEVNVKSAMVSINFDRGTAVRASHLIPSSQGVAFSKYQKEVATFDPDVDGEYVPDFDEFLDGDDQSELSKYLDRKCVDANGREVCYVFWFSVKSDGPVGETTDILGTIKVEKNDFKSLSYLLYEVDYERDENDKIINDKYGFGKVANYTIVGNFTDYPDFDFGYDESGVRYTFSSVENKFGVVGVYNRPFAKFDVPYSSDSSDEGEGNFDTTVYPIDCLFGYTSDAAGKSVDDSSRCATYSVQNGKEHNFQLLVWLQETGKDQFEEQGNEFAGTVAIEVKGDIGGGGVITGKDTRD